MGMHEYVMAEHLTSIRAPARGARTSEGRPRAPHLPGRHHTCAGRNDRPRTRRPPPRPRASHARRQAASGAHGACTTPRREPTQTETAAPSGLATCTRCQPPIRFLPAPNVRTPSGLEHCWSCPRAPLSRTNVPGPATSPRTALRPATSGKAAATGSERGAKQFGQLDAAPTSGLDQESFDVGLHRAGRHNKPVGDLPVGEALAEQLQNLELACGQPVERRARPARRGRSDLGGEERRQRREAPTRTTGTCQ